MSKWTWAALILCLSSHGAAGLAAPHWVAHASNPGPDLPSAGRSRFDQLFADSDNRYRIPFPFSELVARLESQLDNGRASGVRRVLLPMGRSLQRNAPAPYFFRYPRAVIALQGEPTTLNMVLEYRLFIAHQPASDTLEVISYNDRAARFEFQVVEDYASGRQPRVRQANRSMCLSCHQNSAPIFPMRPWSETTFNVEVASRLAAAQPQVFESMIDILSADSGSIDLLAERANYLAAAQLIWQQGCSNARCRAAALRAVLQYRLSGKAGFDKEHAVYRRDYYAELKRSWQRNWPAGLALANSRIVDRDPFTGNGLTRAEDALSPRPAHATWYDVDRVVADGIIPRLGGFFTKTDIRRLDARLAAAGRKLPGASLRLEGNCRLANVTPDTRLLECSGSNPGNRLQAVVELEYSQGEAVSLHFLSLGLPGDPGLLQPGVRALSRLKQGLRAQLSNADGDLSMRLANGDRLREFTLNWQDESLRAQNRFEIILTREFRLVDEALAVMRRRHEVAQGDSLGAKPFRRQALLAELYDAMGLAYIGSGNSRPAKPRPQHRAEPGSGQLKSEDGEDDLALLRPLCSHCHGADTLTPPGFLAGTDKAGRIAQCAPRIMARLDAWQSDSDDAIVPMPPPAIMDTHWVQGDHYRRLRKAIDALLEDRHEAAPRPGLTADEYELLPTCLAG